MLAAWQLDIRSLLTHTHFIVYDENSVYNEFTSAHFEIYIKLCGLITSFHSKPYADNEYELDVLISKVHVMIYQKFIPSFGLERSKT